MACINATGVDKRIVVIDAGHGGVDPGKVGVNNVLEKDINLQIAKLLKEKLEAEGITVLMTRDSDMGLYNEGDSNKKISDMKKRCKIIDESEIDTKTVQVGNTVKLWDEEFDEEVCYTIVGSTEADLLQNRISNESPIGIALLGSKKNQTVEVQAPNGIVKYKVLSITK